MACTLYQLNIVGTPFPPTYSFVDCYGQTITLSGYSLFDNFYLNADDSNPPLSVGSEIKVSTYTGDISKQDVVDCCLQIGGNFYFINSAFPISVSAVIELYYSDGTIVSGMGTKCMSWGPSVSYGILENLSAIKYLKFQGNSCAECLAQFPCNTEYLLTCCDPCNLINAKPSYCFIGTQGVGYTDNITYSLTIDSEFTGDCYTQLVSPILSGYNMYDVVTYNTTFYNIIKESEYEFCSDCINYYPCDLPSPTPTPTQTLTPTPTPTFKPVPTPKVFDYVNECAVITLFPMGVDCSVVHPSPEGTDGIASLIITGGTPPYTILWDNGNISPVIYNLVAGSYGSTVVDYYGDFTAKTTCVLTGSTPTPSPTPTPTPTTPYVEYVMCMETTLLKGDVYQTVQTSYYPDVLFNSRPSWVSGDSTKKIVWDVSVTPNRWIVSATTPTTYIITNSNPAYPPIYGGWFVIGGGSTGSAIVFSGACEGQPQLLNKKSITLEEKTPLTINVSKNDTICGCDGGITILANGGVPPYIYSVDSGLTFKKFPIFNDLCSGIYTVKAIDNDRNEISTSVTLPSPKSPKTYIVSLKTTNKTTRLGSLEKTIEYTTKVSVFPELPDDVTITFDLHHTNISKTSPRKDSSSVETTSILEIDGKSVRSESNTESNSTTLSTLVGCQLDTLYINSVSESWNSITISNKTDLLLTTVTKTYKNEDNDCYVGLSDDTYQITNVSIKGCYCCNATTS